MASGVYNRAKKNFVDGTFDWDDGAAVYRVMLEDSTSTYVFDADDNVVGTNGSGVAEHLLDSGFVELSGTGYARQDVATRVVTEDDTGDKAILDAADNTWSAINAGTVIGAVIYKQSGGSDATPNDDELVCYIDLTDTATNGGDLTIQWSADGVLNLT